MRRRVLLLAMLPVAGLARAQGRAAGQAQGQPPPQAPAAPPEVPGFIQLQPAPGAPPVALAVRQVVRIGHAEGLTAIDTTAFVQQRSVEPAEAVARRLIALGARLVRLTDLNGAGTWIAADRVVVVRGPTERYAAGARAAIVVVGLRFTTDVAVKESVPEVLAALRQALAAAPASGGG
ncbi:hypothetical protein JYK14_01010 [Siccirubricoccus sp. KC 17139]|uniref:DUF4410 domain-containing protein n=1 Tax=Siccirubricoccus soli TaxID=2899147 RepID=A0ABT1D0E9_9PROT|nr:hypothetical protein [Siccirubricoccus soli]MCO6414760.1 hypothetical protein [Siccirubricoccus soli]MCP2680890.1 hypothetical protein [Siccirubricoccus soli]